MLSDKNKFITHTQRNSEIERPSEVSVHSKHFTCERNQGSHANGKRKRSMCKTCPAQLVFQIQITVKNIIEILNTFQKQQNTKYKLHIVYFKYIFKLLIFQILHNPVRNCITCTQLRCIIKIIRQRAQPASLNHFIRVSSHLSLFQCCNTMIHAYIGRLKFWLGKNFHKGFQFQSSKKKNKWSK